MSPNDERPSFWPARRDIFWGSFAALATVIIVYFRLPAIVRGTVWAEDGALFLTQRTRDGAWADFFTPHGGYMQAFPRIATEGIVAFVPLEKYAVAAALSAALVLALLAFVVYVLAAELLPWRPARILFALLPALAPVGTTEVLGNLANLHWAFLAMMPVLLLGKSRSIAGIVVTSAMVFLAVLTEAQVVIFAPLLLVGWRDRRRIPLAAAFVLGAAIQVGAYMSHPRDASHALLDMPSVLQGFIVQSALGSAVGSADVLSRLMQDSGLLWPLIAFGIFLAAFSYAVVFGTPRQRILATALFVGAFVAWGAAVVTNGMSDMNYFSFGASPFPGLNIIRYGYAPSVMLLGILVLAAAITRRHGRQWRAWTIIALMLIVFGLNFRTSSTSRDNGPSWIEGYHGAVTQCLTGTVESVRIPTAPADWKAKVPCSFLTPRP